MTDPKLLAEQGTSGLVEITVNPPLFRDYDLPLGPHPHYFKNLRTHQVYEVVSAEPPQLDGSQTLLVNCS